MPIADCLRCSQGSPLWFKVRSGLLTGTDFRVLMEGGEGALQGLLNRVRRERSGRDEDIDFNKGRMNVASLNWGRCNEPRARAMYEMLSPGRVVREIGFLRHKTLPVGGSPDGLVFEAHDRRAQVGDLFRAALNGIEIKCPFDPDVHRTTLFSGMPGKHRYQVACYMWLAEQDTWEFVSYDPRQVAERDKFFVQVVRRDERLIRAMEDRVHWFFDFVDSGRDIVIPRGSSVALEALLSDGKVDIF